MTNRTNFRTGDYVLSKASYDNLYKILFVDKRHVVLSTTDCPMTIGRVTDTNNMGHYMKVTESFIYREGEEIPYRLGTTREETAAAWADYTNRIVGKLKIMKQKERDHHRKIADLKSLAEAISRVAT